MIDNSLTLLLLDRHTITGTTLLAIVLAALMMMDLMFDRPAPTPEDEQ